MLRGNSMTTPILYETKQISATTAHKMVQQYIQEEIADVLEAKRPYLVYRETGMYWRVPLILKHPITSNTETLDCIDVGIDSGSVQVSEELVQQLRIKAYDFFKATLFYDRKFTH
jgi:hypothetical protein